MRALKIAVASIILPFAFRLASAGEQPDIIFVNGNVYTLNEEQPRAEAVAVRGERITFVGSNADAQKLRGETTRVVDLHGATVTPGFTDSHAHIFGIGERELTLNLEGTNTLADFLAKVRERVAHTGHGKWIAGRGWIETFWQPPQFPTRADLDKIAPENPVVLTRADGHALVANSAAFKIAGITRETVAPFGGEILKDSDGEPTGMLLDNAQGLVERHLPKPTDVDREQAVNVGAKREISLGWCEVQNAGSDLAEQAILRRATAGGKLKLRIYNSVYGPGAAAAELLKAGPTNDASSRFIQRSIKVIFDGALGSRGAALLAPYSDKPDTSGYLTKKESDVAPMLEQALRKGIQVETHAIGDRANRIILDLYERAMKAVPLEQRKIREPRWRVEHAQILSEQDLPRFAKLGVVASMQPSHAISDLFFAPARLGMDRLAGAYAWNSLLKSGAVVCGGSDAPVERGEPMIEFYAAVARKSVKGEQHEGWHPEQAVTREQALKLFTKSAAFAAFEENDKGTIAPGKLADLTVLSADIMKIPEPEILTTRCVMTVIGGAIEFEAGSTR